MKDIGFVIPKPKEEDKDPEVIDTTTIQEIIEPKKALWKVYPNPANDKITVELIDQTEVLNTEFVIQNINGQTVLEIENLNPINRIDITDLSNGVYFLQISNSTQSQSIRLVKY